MFGIESPSNFGQMRVCDSKRFAQCMVSNSGWITCSTDKEEIKDHVYRWDTICSILWSMLSTRYATTESKSVNGVQTQLFNTLKHACECFNSARKFIDAIDQKSWIKKLAE